MCMVQTLGTLVTTKIAGKWVLIPWKYGNNRYCSIAISNFEVWTSMNQSMPVPFWNPSHHKNGAITTTSSLLRVANGLSDLMLFREVLHGSVGGMGTIQEWRDVLWGFPTEAKYSKGHWKTMFNWRCQTYINVSFMYLHNKETMSSVTWVGQTNPTIVSTSHLSVCHMPHAYIHPIGPALSSTSKHVGHCKASPNSSRSSPRGDGGS